MEFRHILTRNDGDRAAQEIFDTFWAIDFYRSPEDNNPQLLGLHLDFRETPPGGRPPIPRLYDLIGEFPPSQIHDGGFLYSHYANRTEKISFRSTTPISAEQRLGSGLVLVNLPVPFSKVVGAYPNAVVAGYARSDEEQAQLREACGVDGAYFFRYGRGQEDATRFVHSSDTIRLLGLSGFRGLVTEYDIDPIIAEGARKDLLAVSTGCSTCQAARRYFDVQQLFLQRGDVRGLFRLSPVADLAEESEYPLIGSPGRCHRYHPLTQEFLGRGICKGIESHNQSDGVAGGFVERYNSIAAQPV